DFAAGAGRRSVRIVGIDERAADIGHHIFFDVDPRSRADLDLLAVLGFGRCFARDRRGAVGSDGVVDEPVAVAIVIDVVLGRGVARRVGPGLVDVEQAVIVGVAVIMAIVVGVVGHDRDLVVDHNHVIERDVAGVGDGVGVVDDVAVFVDAVAVVVESGDLVDGNPRILAHLDRGVVIVGYGRIRLIGVGCHRRGVVDRSVAAAVAVDVVLVDLVGVGVGPGLARIERAVAVVARRAADDHVAPALERILEHDVAQHRVAVVGDEHRVGDGLADRVGAIAIAGGALVDGDRRVELVVADLDGGVAEVAAALDDLELMIAADAGGQDPETVRRQIVAGIVAGRGLDRG